jgi:hypothetical protein
MQTVSRSSFTTVTTEGAILPADLLQRIVDGRELEGLRPKITTSPPASASTRPSAAVGTACWASGRASTNSGEICRRKTGARPSPASAGCSSSSRSLGMGAYLSRAAWPLTKQTKRAPDIPSPTNTIAPRCTWSPSASRSIGRQRARRALPPQPPLTAAGVPQPLRPPPVGHRLQRAAPAGAARQRLLHPRRLPGI